MGKGGAEGEAWWRRGARLLLFPPHCELCRTPLDDGRLCEPCTGELCATADAPACPRCGGLAGPHAAGPEGCAACRDNRYGFGRVLRLGSYRGLLAHACREAKEWPSHRVGAALADLLARRRAAELSALRADVVVPVPLHWRRRWGRGFNQAELLADRLANVLAVPLLPDALVRRRATPPQSSLPPNKRRGNVNRAFRADPRRVRGLAVLLVDDILTTGSTCDQAARALLAQGAARVDVAVVARADFRTGAPTGLEPLPGPVEPHVPAAALIVR